MAKNTTFTMTTLYLTKLTVVIANKYQVQRYIHFLNKNFYMC